jgi:beta-N-acetylhexosaminidase
VQSSITPAPADGSVASADKPQVKGASDTQNAVVSPTDQPLNPEDEFVTSQMEQMTIKEKIGQMFLWDISEKKLTDDMIEVIRQTHAGGVILMGNRTISDVSAITKQLQSLDTALPLFISIDQEGGVVKRLIDDPNPGAPALGKMEPEEICSVVQNTTSLLSENGVNLNFGIVADVGWHEDSFIKNRTFSTDIDTVSEAVNQAVTCTTGVFSTVKHFPGHGRTKLNSHVTIPEISTPVEDWQETDLIPFQNAIDADVDMVMMGHLVYSEIASDPASLSPKHIQKVRDMGFDGVITTDDMGMLETAGEDPYESLNKAINSGIDMMLYVRTEEEPIDLYEHAVDSMVKNKEMENRIDESVERILRMKYSLTEDAI